MTEPEGENWEQARTRVIARWKEILNRIEVRDEGGVLGLANVIDEFCEEAIATRMAVLHGQAPIASGLLKFSGSSASIGTRCLFCRAFQEAGGCFGMLASLNSFVMAGKWDDAREVAGSYLKKVESMSLAGPPETPVS